MEDVNISIYRASVVREGSTPASPGFVVSDGQNPVDPSGSGQNHLPVTIATAATGLSITESQVLGGAGTVGQYIRGDGSLADFPESSGGGSSVSYYLNGSVSQGTIGGVAYKELNKVPILGAGTDFTINADGYIASFLTDAGDPNLLEIPGGNWNFETYFSASSSGGTPTFYVELYKVNSGGTATLIASNSGFPELIAFGTNIISYFSTLAVPTTALALTDRLAIRYYVTHSGRTITLHTEDNHLCQIITTFTTGITALNGLTAQVQNFAVGTSGTDFAIASATATHTFNLPTASATNRGALSSADWTTFNNKTSNLGTVTSVGLSSATSGVTIGSTPVTTSGTITLAIATASGSQNGLLSSTDWTTFNGKQNALTNPVTGTGTTNYLPKFTGSTTIGNSNIQDSGSLVTINSDTKFQVGANATRNVYFGTAATNYGRITYNDSTGELAIGTIENYNTLFVTNNTTKMTLTSGGNLLVGTTTDNGARLQVSGTATVSGNVTIGQATAGTNVKLIFNGVLSKAAGIEFHQSGTPQWYIGNGIASEDNNFELYNSNGTMAMKIIKSTNAINFIGAATFSSSVSTKALSATTSGAGNLTAYIGNNVTSASGSTGYGLAIESEASAATSYAFTCRNLSGSNTYFLISTETGKVGNVGIGTVSPVNKLSVLVDGGGADDGIRIGVGSQGDGIKIVQRYLSDRVVATLGQSNYGVVTDSGALRLYDVGGTETVRLSGKSGYPSFITSGNVLIGMTTDNGAKLQVAATSAIVTVTSTTGTSFNGIELQNSGGSFYVGQDNSAGNFYGSGTAYAACFYTSQNRDFVFFNGANQRMRISSSGDVFINHPTNVGEGKLRVSQDGSLWNIEARHTFSTQYFMLFRYNSTGLGSITGNGSSVAFNTTSDYRLKEDLKEIKGLEKVQAIKVYDYKWKSNDIRMDGVLAHELATVLPYAVHGEKDGEYMQGVDYSKLVPIMVKAIQELKQEIDTLKN